MVSLLFFETMKESVKLKVVPTPDQASRHKDEQTAFTAVVIKPTIFILDETSKPVNLGTVFFGQLCQNLTST
jgi:hypothetical protein